MNHCRERTTDANSSRQRSFTSHDRHLPCLFQIPIEYPTGKIIMIFQQGDHENSLKRFCSKIHWTRTYATKSLTTTATAILYHQLIIEHQHRWGTHDHGYSVLSIQTCIPRASFIPNEVRGCTTPPWTAKDAPDPRCWAEYWLQPLPFTHIHYRGNLRALSSTT